MRFVLIALILLSFHASAERGPKEIELNPESALKLGFSIDVKEIDGVTLIDIEGPIENQDKCIAAKNGSFLLDATGNELAVYQSDISSDGVKPKASGYYSNKTHSMGVYIDYLCADKPGYVSTRYTIQSISDWLITKQSTGLR